MKVYQQSMKSLILESGPCIPLERQCLEYLYFKYDKYRSSLILIIAITLCRVNDLLNKLNAYKTPYVE